MEIIAPNEANFKMGNFAAVLLDGSRSTPVRQESVFQTPNEPNFYAKLFEYIG
jgi:hypothetical protein